MTVAVETGLWQLDATASTVTVRNKTMWGLATVNGTFGVVAAQGEVKTDRSAAGTLTLEAASLDTKNAKRDEHLRSADFFDVASHPQITFAADHVERAEADTVNVAGQLTVRGVTKPLSFTARLTGVDAEALTLEGEFTVDRAEFGMGKGPLGMMALVTTVSTTLRFRRATV